MEQWMPCPAKPCAYEQWVSPEDEDASFSELWNHVLWSHAGVDQQTASDLMIKVVIVEKGTS